MRAVLEFAMRGRRNVIGMAFVCTLLPLLNWFATALIGLVMLRKGPQEALIVLLWASIPLALGIYYVGDPSPAIAMIGTVLLAYVLRVSSSWEVTLAVGVVISAIGSLIFEFTATELLTTIVEWYMEYTAMMAAQLQQTSEMTFESAKASIMGFFAMGQAYAMLAFLVLARWWQSQLYNPGGLRKEFHQIRLSRETSTVVVVLLLVCFSFSGQLGRWIPLLTVPLFMAALSIVHWMMGVRKMSGQWVFGFYVLLLVLFQVIYPLLATLAILDSWFNLRARIQSKEV
ncbi:MAG: hypothetical protein VB957_02080 [Pseudomonadales bacterium]